MGLGWVGLGAGAGAGAGGAMGEVTNVMKAGRDKEEKRGKEGMGQVKGRTEYSRSILPPSSIPHALMCTTHASVFTSSSAFTSTSQSNAYLPGSNSSAIATATATQPPTPSKIMPMTTEEDEENMEAGRRLAILQREHAGSVATMISAYPHNGTRSRSDTLNLTGGGMLAPPEALGSGENVNARGQGQGSIALRAVKSVRWLARMGSRAQGLRIEEREREEEKQKGKVGEMGKEKDDARKKDGKKENAAADGRVDAEGRMTGMMSLRGYESGSAQGMWAPRRWRAVPRTSWGSSKEEGASEWAAREESPCTPAFGADVGQEQAKTVRGR
ncbi:hypothetical protein CVT25_005330 [Psilocybe cyanescens]|uniref:Uncharacterized protein n=1 Tax=Psilocybe cyanescens TaxID=93625 RepID=A0A409W473_PSICY|nr:hypothetical protein CVT25_005330 [Psilocybe cyanescens]